MAVTCRTCNQMFQNIAEVADHIGDTNKGFQGEWRGFSTDKPTQQDNEQLTDAIRGFSHVNYINERGQMIPVVELYPLLMAGARICFECEGIRFGNNYRLWEHIIYEGHTKDLGNGNHLQDAIRNKKEADDLETKYF